MKEREQPFRNYLVCYNGERCIGWKSVAELNELLNQKEVNWYMEKGQPAVQIKLPEEQTGQNG